MAKGSTVGASGYGVGLRVLGFRGFGVWGLRFRFAVSGFGLRVYGLGLVKFAV